MTETTHSPMEMVVTTNSAPDVQQTPEMVTTEPTTPLETTETTPVETVKAKPEPTQEQRDNDRARETIQEKIRADNLQRQVDELKPKEVIPDKEPDINDYKTLDEYKADYKKWAKEEGKREERTANTQAQEARKQAEIRANVATKEQESRAKHSDFDSVVAPIVPIISGIPILKDFIAKNPMGTEVVYELAKNPAILDQIMRADVWDAGECLLSMAARLKNPPAVTVSNAPEPIKPVGSREAIKPKLADLASKDINGYIAKRNKDELAKRRSN